MLFRTELVEILRRLQRLMVSNISNMYDGVRLTEAPDPLFFLHHTQLDRLWWLWQKRQPGGGLEAYSGRKERHSIEKASLDDLIETQGLAERVKVADVMDIHDDLLCYDY